MFQSLRQNSQIYIFHKSNNPTLEIGYITNAPLLKPKYQVSPILGQAQDMVVDLTAKVNNQIVNYTNIPAQLDIADSFNNGESIVISDSRDAMNSEILSFQQKSIDAINSVDLHKQIIVGCDDILNKLNPEYAEKKQQQDEISTLKTQMTDIQANLATLTELIGKLKETKK